MYFLRILPTFSEHLFKGIYMNGCPGRKIATEVNHK